MVNWRVLYTSHIHHIYAWLAVVVVNVYDISAYANNINFIFYVAQLFTSLTVKASKYWYVKLFSQQGPPLLAWINFDPSTDKQFIDYKVQDETT